MSGCSSPYSQTQQTFYSDRNYLTGANYLTFDHAFTDLGATDAKRRAAAQCAQRKQTAVQTSAVCSLTACTTSFQCMKPEDAAKFQADGGWQGQQ